MTAKPIPTNPDSLNTSDSTCIEKGEISTFNNDPSYVKKDPDALIATPARTLRPNDVTSAIARIRSDATATIALIRTLADALETAQDDVTLYRQAAQSFHQTADEHRARLTALETLNAEHIRDRKSLFHRWTQEVADRNTLLETIARLTNDVNTLKGQDG